ncbi:MAG: hypothetical protein LBC77_05910 [Spirochaetaceae bacterium]|jgi:hypothetical protein|nr:hypothetical protein [Spirochaetaceae bacterium]
MRRANGRGGLRRVIFFVFLLPLFALSTPLFSLGRADPVLARADELVKEKRFHEAVQLLSNFIKSDDVRFDAAQTRIRKILQDHEFYNQLVHKLMDAVEAAPEDFDAIVAIADELRALDAPPNSEIRRFVGRIQEVARFSVNRRAIEEILREARVLLDAKDYIAAMRKYESGFTLFQVELREANFGRNIESSTFNTLAAIQSAIAEAADALSHVNSARVQVESMRGRENSAVNRQTLEAAVEAVSPQLDALIRVKEVFTQAEAMFLAYDAMPEIDQSGKAGRHFFAMSALYVRGRGNETIREGMLGAVDGIWKDSVIQMAGAYDDIAEKLYQSAMATTERGSGNAARAAIAAAKEFIGPVRMLSDKSQVFVNLDQNELAKRFNTDVAALVNHNAVRFSSMDNALDYFSFAVSVGARFSEIATKAANSGFLAAWKGGSDAASQTIDALKDTKNIYTELADEVRVVLGEIETERAASPLEVGRKYYGDAHKVISALGSGIFSGEISHTELVYRLVNENLKTKVNALEDEYAAGEKLLTGVPIKTEQGKNIVAKYSREAGERFDGIQDGVDAGLALSQGVLEEYKKDENRLESGSTVRRLELEAEDLNKRFVALKENSTRDLEVAQDRAGHSESLRIDGERLIAASKSALGMNNFDEARERLENAASRWAESLELQENPALRRDWTNQIDPLSAEIARLEYDYTLREVRGLINNARQQYFATEFQSAEETLMRAESRWARVSPTANEELVLWLGYVRGALSVRSGSIVPVTAPLYPEISQLLSDAKKNYQDALSLFRASKREEGMMKFAAAKEKTQEIKLMFPVNQEAGILELRIEQVSDPNTFEVLFRQRYAAAVAGTKRGARESYFELENLAEINPSFPGISAALNEAKYDVGLLQRPLDRAAETESANLLAQARRTFSRGRAGYAEALRLAGRALSVNPNNTGAMQLVDRLRLAIRDEQVRNAVVADQNAEQEYLAAVREFQRGNSITAMTIIQRLLQNPAYKNNTRFNELYRRIAATL